MTNDFITGGSLTTASDGPIGLCRATSASDSGVGDRFALDPQVAGVLIYKHRRVPVVGRIGGDTVQLATDSDGSPVYHQGRGLTLLWLGLMRDRARLRIELWDTLPASAGVPVLRHPGQNQEHGRGLGIVNRLSLAWGWQPLPGGHAKYVWALLDVPPIGRPAPRGRKERR
jgi:hypothetical protein